MQKTVLHNQSLIDFTLHHCGTLDGIMAMAVENNISITEILTPGQVLTIPNEIIKDIDIVGFYETKRVIPASGFNTLENEALQNMFAYEFPIIL
ncbi:hypothetical protein [Flavobacterium covae]|uniref:hypothetical protein n=1 Tax=Flavobacterium covae TaxID=2906076 RepID=UPI000745AFB9|nr:hypothetical protein [Flavobacterium covae]AMA48997.1 hypothetical protein AWN65_05720 [Flavobacterium covae]MCJ1809916.1 hypothetical protein [Flavobacterium covae]